MSKRSGIAGFTLKNFTHAQATPRRKPRHEETRFQTHLVDIFDKHVSSSDAFMFAVPNGEARDARTGAFLKAMGVRKGVVDLVLIARSIWFIEVKKPHVEGEPQGKLSKSQIEFRDFVIAKGHNWRQCESFDQFFAILAEAGVPCSVRMSL
jgi:hypothetical protein